MPTLVLANEDDANKRRVYFHLVDSVDGISAELSEAGGQPQISSDGAAFTNTGIGTLTHAGNGRYYADLTQAAVATAGTLIQTRYKSAATAECPGDSVQVIGFDPSAATVPAVVTDKTGFSLSAAGVQAIWDALTSALTTVGSIGKWILDKLDAAVSTRLAPAVAGRVLDVSVSQQVSVFAIDDDVLGSILNQQTSTMTTVGSFGKLVVDNLDATISSRMATFSLPTNFSSFSINGSGHVVLADSSLVTAKLGTFVLAKTTNISGFNDLSAAQVNAEADTALSDVGVTTTVTGRIDAAVSSRMATFTYTAPLDAAGTRTAIGLASANLDTQLGDLPTNAELTTALGGISFPTADQNANALLDLTDGVETNLTLRQWHRLGAAVLFGKSSGDGAIYRDIGDTKARVTATLDATGNRTAVTRDAT